MNKIAYENNLEDGDYRKSKEALMAVSRDLHSRMKGQKIIYSSLLKDAV